MSSARVLRRSTVNPALLLALATAALVTAADSISAQGRARPPRAGTRAHPQSSVTGTLATHDLSTRGETPDSLVQALVGAGAVVSNIQYSGAPIAAGTFTGGTGIIGFDNGVLLSSGNIASVVGPLNTTDFVSTQNGTPGDSDLDAIVDVGTGGITRDAAILEFDLDCSNASQISFQYVFTSDEYDEIPWEDDVFACFVNGQNIALIPGSNTHVGVLFLNCSTNQEFDPTGGVNCGFYKTNDCSTLGLGFPCSHIATEMDGLSVVLSATGTLQPGLNHIKLALADQGDEYVDSVVFLRAQSLVCSPGGPVFETPLHCEQVLDGWPGTPLSFDVRAWATNTLPGESIRLDVSGDSTPLAGGTFVPPLPSNPAQPGFTHFQWTPTAADLGTYHLLFTGTDQLQLTTTWDVTLRISQPGPPVFTMPSPCGQILEATVGSPFGFGINASAWNAVGCGITNGTPGQAVTLTASGDASPLYGGTFVPPLPAGPSQPVSTQFQWTPTAADVGLQHLVFTATDQLQQSASCDVGIRVSLPPPVFQAPSPCGATLNAYAGQPFGFGIAASATNGQPGESATLEVAGDPIPLAGGTFVPPLPTGPAQPVSTQFQWTPTPADVGLYNLDFTATDQFQQTASCGVAIRVWGLPGVDLCQAGTGIVIPCPCGNPPASAPRGCDNSSATGGARLESVGAAVFTQDTLVFTTTGETPTALSILFQGNVSLPTGAIFGQGVRCAGGHLVRLFTKTANGGSITAPEPGEESVWFRSRDRGVFIRPGKTMYYGVYYRDPTILGGCPGTATFNVTQTQSILWR